MGARSTSGYVFLGQTTSTCAECLALVPAKIVREGERVYFLKRCAEHGSQKVLICDDFAWYRRTHDYFRPGDRPLAVHTRTERGCPWDCGLCPDHEQHSCLAIIEVNQHCNLRCPICFAGSSPEARGTLELEQICAMLDALVDAEGEPDLVQISGGEPTLHPQILEILRAAMARPIRHVMLNTNGTRIARDADLVQALAELGPGFEVYLQFDALDDDGVEDIRGSRLGEVRTRALAALEAADIATTLVAVVKRGVNDDQLGDIVRHALAHRCVRGVAFQPVQDAGRTEGFSARAHRITLGEVRRALIEQCDVFADADIVPLPCNPEYIALGYGLREGTSVTPLTALLAEETLREAAPNAISLDTGAALRERLVDVLSLASAGSATGERLAELLCCLPGIPVPAGLGYADTFRVSIVQFLDRHNFCLAGVKRSCVHFVTPDLSIIPFDTYNLFYRSGLATAQRAARGAKAGRARRAPR